MNVPVSTKFLAVRLIFMNRDETTRISKVKV